LEIDKDEHASSNILRCDIIFLISACEKYDFVYDFMFRIFLRIDFLKRNGSRYKNEAVTWVECLEFWWNLDIIRILRCDFCVVFRTISLRHYDIFVNISLIKNTYSIWIPYWLIRFFWICATLPIVINWFTSVSAELNA